MRWPRAFSRRACADAGSEDRPVGFTAGVAQLLGRQVRDPVGDQPSTELAEGQGAGLVEAQDIDPPQGFEGLRVADQSAP